MVDIGTATTTNDGRLPGVPPEWLPAGPPIPDRPQPPDPLVPPPPTHTLPMIVTPIFEPADPQTRLLRQRIVLLTGCLDQAAADAISAQLLLLDNESNRPIQIRVSCPDSELDAAQSLLGTLDLIGAPVHAVAVGPVSGPAVAVFAAAVRREAHPHATFVLRESTAQLAGDAEHLAAAAEQHRRQLDSIVERIASATGRAAAAVGADLRSGRFLTAEQAVGYGLVQTILS